jgi:hypothetical protein
VLKPIISKDHKIYEDKFISQNIYNAIMSRYISFNPSGMWLKFTYGNWEAGTKMERFGLSSYWEKRQKNRAIVGKIVTTSIFEEKSIRRLREHS